MGFLGLNMGFISQFLVFLSGGPNLFLTIYFKYYYKDDKGIQVNYIPNYDNTELVLCLAILFIRTFIIGARYGYTKRSKVELRKKGFTIPSEVYSKEFLLQGWRNVSAEILDLEIKYSILRNEIEPELFYINTLTLLNKAWITRLTSDSYHEVKKNKDENIEMYRIDTRKINLKGLNINQVNLDEKIENEKYNSNKSINFQKNKKFDHKKYANIIPLLNLIKEEKLNKFDLNKYLAESINKYNDETIAEKQSERKKSVTYFTFINNLGKKMSNFRDSSTIILNKVDDSEMQEEAEIPVQLRKADLELFLLPLPARIIIREYFLHSKERIKPFFLILFFVLSILQSMVPSIYRKFNNNNIFGENFLESYLIIITFLNLSLTFAVSMVFLEVGGNDFERKRFVLECLSSMITPNKKSIEEIHIRNLPLINYFCAKNIKNWMNMRVIAMDIGLRYMKRIELYASIFLFTYSLITALLILGIYGFIKGFTIKTSPIFYIMGFFESFISFLALYRMLYLGADINNFFKRHILELNTIKSKFQDVANNFYTWLKMTSYVDSHLEKIKDFYYYCILYHRLKTSEEKKNDLKSSIFFPNPENPGEFVEYLKSLSEEYNKIIEQIQYLEEKSCLRILGFKLSNELLGQFYFGVITLLYSLGQMVLNELNGTKPAS